MSINMYQEVSRVEYNVIHIIKEETLQLKIGHDVIRKTLSDYMNVRKITLNIG